MKVSKEVYKDVIIGCFTLLFFAIFCFGVYFASQGGYSKFYYKEYNVDHILVDSFYVKSVGGTDYKRRRYINIAVGKLEKNKSSTSILIPKSYRTKNIRRIPIWIRMKNGKRIDLFFKKPNSTTKDFYYEFLKGLFRSFCIFFLPFILIMIYQFLR